MSWTCRGRVTLKPSTEAERRLHVAVARRRAQKRRHERPPQRRQPRVVCKSTYSQMSVYVLTPHHAAAPAARSSLRAHRQGCAAHSPAAREPHSSRTPARSRSSASAARQQLRPNLGAISAAISARARRSREPVPERLLAALGQQAIER